MQSYPGTQSVVRAIRLLKLFGRERSEWTLSDLVETIGLNKTTVFRMLTALEGEGLLERSERGSYHLGPEMVALGGRAMMHNNMRQVASPLLESLVETTGERTTLEQLVTDPDGNHAMLVLAEIKGKHLLSVNQVVGSRLPMNATSTGKALMAFMQADVCELILRQNFRAATEKTIIDSDDMKRELAAIRQQGYAIAIGELEVGLMAAGAPIYNHTGQPVATISIEGPDSRIDEARLHELGKQLVTTAEQISYRLGYAG